MSESEGALFWLIILSLWIERHPERSLFIVHASDVARMNETR